MMTASNGGQKDNIKTVERLKRRLTCVSCVRIGGGGGRGPACDKNSEERVISFEEMNVSPF